MIDETICICGPQFLISFSFKHASTLCARGAAPDTKPVTAGAKQMRMCRLCAAVEFAITLNIEFNNLRVVKVIRSCSY